MLHDERDPQRVPDGEGGLLFQIRVKGGGGALRECLINNTAEIKFTYKLIKLNYKLIYKIMNRLNYTINYK